MSRKTPLYEAHLRQGGKLVDFAGWSLPVQFQGLREEHMNVRTKVGLFDVSHMGEIRVRGKKALESLEWLTTNHVAKLQKNEAQYTLLPNEKGGLVDDLIVYCLEPNSDYLLCVNASNKDKDLAWILKHNKGADVTDDSDLWAQIAVQGPQAIALTEKVYSKKLQDIGSFKFREEKFAGVATLVARTGYTGEDGCEIFVPAAKAEELWESLLKLGKDLGVGPCGLGARDTLRTEMKYSLYGHEISDVTNPYEAGLGWVVKPQVKAFMGREVILQQKEAGLKRKLVGIKMLENGIPRQDYKLLSLEQKEIGIVTSGTLSPSLNLGIAIAYLNQEFAAEGQELLVQIRQRTMKAQVVKTPFIGGK